MYKKIKYIVAVLILLGSISVHAQITTQSPYSKYGIGNLKGSLLPQLRAIGGISTAIYKPTTLYSNINMQNPASYSGISLTTIDIGMSGGFTTLKQNNAQESSFNSTLSHVALAFPIVTNKSALSIGILPYSEIGYEYSASGKLDTNNVNYLYSGEGGLTKAYIGYGQQFGDHFRVGANVEYLFGNLLENRSTELQAYPTFNSRMQNKNSVGGVTFSYGLQYEIPLGNKKRITLGYSGSSASSVNSEKSYLVTQYLKDATGEESSAFDTLETRENGSAKLKLPLIHNFGIAIQKDNKWLIGADYRTGKWSHLTIEGVNQGLQDSWGFSAGGQYTPDLTATRGYFNFVEYRLGFMYDKSYIRMNNQDIKQMAVTFGFGLPLGLNSRTGLYKMNFTTEIGKRGSMSNSLLQENYINLHLGFTLNDKWFTRYKFD